MSGNRCVSSYDPRTGELHWEMDGPTEQFVASMVDDGLVYFTADNGITKVVRAGPKFELIGQCSLGEACYTFPAPSGQQIFIRTQEKLYCIGKFASQ
jgi:outer membrane protein assembly factor BamB